jgi:hypothetical protein
VEGRLMTDREKKLVCAALSKLLHLPIIALGVETGYSMISRKQAVDILMDLKHDLIDVPSETDVAISSSSELLKGLRYLIELYDDAQARVPRLRSSDDWIIIEHFVGPLRRMVRTRDAEERANASHIEG